MGNIHDWARQLWWDTKFQLGIAKETGEVYVGMEAKRYRKLTQDPDVLDTWFPSALWPFSTMGWPDEEAS